MSTQTSYPLVVVTPVYEDAEASGRLFQELACVLGSDIHVVAVDDGSIRQPVAISSLARAGLRGTVLTLKRNEGHQRAIAVGLSYVVDRFGPDAGLIVTMDSDGEDVPATMQQLTVPLQSQDVDIVVAQRRSRAETVRFRIFYQVYKRMFHLLTGRRISFGNFMAMTPRAAAKLVGMHELWIHVAGCVLASRMRIAGCPLDRGPRYAGRSKLNFVGLALHGFRGLMVFAEDVLVRVGIACATVAGLSVLAMGVAVALKLAGLATPGWFSVALGILLLVLLQTGTLTLTMLMLTGVVRSAGANISNYKELIASIAHTHEHEHGGSLQA
jgi:glycosyltransferase involved in cell wall biosynthesis